MPEGNDGSEKRHENLHFFEILFLEFQETQEERLKRCNVHGMGNTKTYTSRILCFLNFEELKEIVGGWSARVRARNEEQNGEVQEWSAILLKKLTFLSFFDS